MHRLLLYVLWHVRNKREDSGRKSMQAPNGAAKEGTGGKECRPLGIYSTESWSFTTHYIRHVPCEADVSCGIMDDDLELFKSILSRAPSVLSKFCCFSISSVARDIEVASFTSWCLFIVFLQERGKIWFTLTIYSTVWNVLHTSLLILLWKHFTQATFFLLLYVTQLIIMHISSVFPHVCLYFCLLFIRLFTYSNIPLFIHNLCLFRYFFIFVC